PNRACRPNVPSGGGWAGRSAAGPSWHPHHHGRQRHHRADREVDARGDDDEGGPQAQDPVDGGGQQNAHHVVEREKIGRRQGKDDHQADEAAEGEEFARRGRVEAGFPAGRPGGDLPQRHQLHGAISPAWSDWEPPLRTVAYRMIVSSVAWAASNSAVIRPSLMTTMRWLKRRISGSSEEIMMIDLPCRVSSFISL